MQIVGYINAQGHTVRVWCKNYDHSCAVRQSLKAIGVSKTYLSLQTAEYAHYCDEIRAEVRRSTPSYR